MGGVTGILAFGSNGEFYMLEEDEMEHGLRIIVDRTAGRVPVYFGSVSGYNYFPVDLAIKANEMGCATIALTSVEYSSHLTSKHPSGKRLFEACTYCIDNCTNYGDTLVDVPALGQGICPASGISASYLMWALQSTVVEKLLAKGLKPSVYISNHMPNAPKINGEALERYNEFGY